MRLRNIPGAAEAVQGHEKVIHQPEACQGGWQQAFGNDHPINLELGMGKGQFLLSMAKKDPDQNWIGMERYDSVLLRALQRFDTEEYASLDNIRFICADAGIIETIFAPGEIQSIYLNFPDPWPKARNAKRRLTSRTFLSRYENLLPAGGRMEFKTDDRDLFEFSLEEIKAQEWRLIACTYDLYQDEEMNRDNVMTEYEEKFAQEGKKILKLIAGPTP